MPVQYTALPVNEAHEVAGVRIAAVQAHVRKPNRYDMLLVEFAEGTQVGGVFTQSRFAAAPVQVCRDHLVASTRMRALVVNTGIANAATGELGLTNAHATCERVARALGIPAQSVLPFSTGVILEHLPMDRIAAGVDAAADALKAGTLADWARAAQTIMTTDTVYKLASEQIVIAGNTVNITGISKGAGMIQPNMATMLGFIVTDAAIAAPLMQPLAKRIADASFNRVTVDGDTSTARLLQSIRTMEKSLRRRLSV
jgi:glutamate N-acetyltransferase / amino-acid N-acetyltransferase